MLYYAFGTRPDQAIVTLTEISHLAASAGEPQCPEDEIYMPSYLQCCKVVKITDPTEKIIYSWANLNIGDATFKVSTGNYIHVKEGQGVECYISKAAVYEDIDPHSSFNGVKYKHFHNGLLNHKLCYVAGSIHKQYTYRNNTHNTLERITMYNQGKPEIVFQYDDNERLLEQMWLTRNGQVYSTRPVST